MATFFGQCDSSGNPLNSNVVYSGAGTITFSNLGTEASFTCPGSGTQNVVDLKIYAILNSASANVRLAIYSADRSTLIGQGSSEVAVSGSIAWVGHTWSASWPQLTGGTKYILAVATDDNIGSEGYASGSSIGKYLTGVDYTSGFPASIAAGDASNEIWPIRCGVEDAVVATIEQEGFRFRNDDGSESAATWKASQDTNITLAAATAARIRMILNATGDPASIGAQLEARYKPTGGSFGPWTKVN